MNSVSGASKDVDWPTYTTLDPYSVLYDRVLNRFKFSLKYTVLDRFRLTFPGNDLHELIGFEAGNTEWSVDHTIASIRPTTTDNSAYTFMSSLELDRSLTLCSGYRRGPGPDAMQAFAWFPNSTSKGDVIHHLWPSQEDVRSRQTVFRPPRSSISSMGFKILNAKGDVLETHGIDVDFVLRVYSGEKDSDDLIYDSVT